TSDQRDNRIYEIKYTGNSVTGQQPYNLVKFHYKTRTDQNTTYEHGNNVESRYLLDRIEVKAESSNVKTYEFKYSFDNFRSVLNSVAERGANGYSLNTTIFKYGDEPSGMSTVSSSIFAGTAVDLFSGDFDGDGYSDILTAPSAIYNGIRYNTHLQVYKRTATNPSFTQSYSTALPADFQVVNGVNRPNMYNFLASDYTGDGRDDIMTLKVRIEGSQNWRKLKEFKLYRSLGTTFTASIQYPAPGFDIVHPSWKYFYPGDFDGDGATDYITFLSNGTGYKAFVSFPRKAIYNQEVTGLGSGSYPATDWMNADYIYVIDFDGDGKQELMRIDEGMTYIHTFTQTGNTLNSSIVYQAGYPTKWHRLYFGDFNGDRKTDMLVRTSQTLNSASWEKAFSTGTNFVVSNFSFQQTPDIRDLSGDDKLVISDFNGDGLMDILHGWVDPGTISSTSTIGMYYSRGNDFNYETNAFDGLLGLVPLVTYDLNGDGRSDIINRTVYTSPFTIFYFKKEGRELLMESAVDGFLNRTNFDYRRMTQTAGGFYSKGGAPFHPVNNIQFPLYLTYQMRKDDGIGGEFVKRYSYGEAKLHKEGKGFLGFKYFNSTDLDHNSRMEHVKSLSTDYYALKPYRIEKYVNSTNDLLSKITISGEYTARPNMGYWYRINSRLENKYFEGQNTSTFYNYDNYGNRTEETIYQGNVFTRKTTITYGQHGTPVPSKPTTINTWSQRNGQIAHSITSKYTYNSKGQVTQQEEFHGHPQEVTTTYTYHNLGPQKTVTVAASGLSSRTTTTNYDSKGRFVTQTINPLGQSSTATYDIKWGKPLTTTGVHGLTNSYEYDPFGRLTRTTRPEGHKLNESYLWFVSPSYGT
ncbi:MAG: FG-GAP-like repeat-containing protein, partial [Bacteroidota bacterium]